MYGLADYLYSHLYTNAQIYSYNRIPFADIVIKTYLGYHYNLSLLCMLSAAVNTS